MASLIARGGTILPKYNALILYLVIVLSDSHLVTGWIGREIVTCRTKDVLRSGDASDRGGEGGVRRPRPILQHRSSLHGTRPPSLRTHHSHGHCSLRPVTDSTSQDCLRPRRVHPG